MYKKIGQILLESGSVSEELISRTLDLQTQGGHTRRFGEILIELGISEEEIYKALSIQFEMPLMEAADVPEQMPLDHMSFSFLEKNLIVPLAIKGNTLSIAVGDPWNSEGVDALRSSFDYELSVILAKKSDLLSG